MKFLKSVYGIVGLMLSLTILSVNADRLVILHTNDTHSQIEPDGTGAGGILQRKAIVDSVRRAEKNVILVDAGDIVQGTLYFKYFRGDVEFPLANMMGYDIQVMGNHEFDNGLEELAEHYKKLKAARLDANYDFTGTPMEGLMDDYIIRKVGKHKVGFIGVGVDPESLISQHNYAGMRYKDVVETVNRLAGELKGRKGCDLVVVVSHLGARKENEKTTDYELAAATTDVDIIIGGHSHTVIQPGTKASDRPDLRPGESKFSPSIVENADGRPVLVVQTGKYGKLLGYINIDLDHLGDITPADFDYRLISVSDRFDDDALDPRMKAFIAPYKAKVDSVKAHVIGQSYYELSGDDRTGGYPNFIADFAMAYGKMKADSLRLAGYQIGTPDFAVMNVGGIRHNLPQGDVTEGRILETFPFTNYIVMQRVKGTDFIAAMRMAASKGGEGVSDEVRVLTDADGELYKVLLNGEEMDPDKDYLMVTLDYVAEGNDDFVTFAGGERVWDDDQLMVTALLRHINAMSSQGLPIAPDITPRFLKAYMHE
ncbi:MAG: bifunctional metallophosphatase/5'-nucleotidase [Muribaculaceae bacterium]|nr:bifunctional metallophosphatase/5'-nucleotidase [Muribaculaceae bacterium]